MEKEIFFISNWCKDRTKTWSGTNLGIFTALKEHYNIIDVDIHTEYSIFKRLLRKLGIVNKTDMGLSLMPKMRKIAEKRIPQNTECKVLQFAPLIHDTSLIHTYIYQDLGADYVAHLENQMPDIFKFSAFQHNSHEVIRIRQKSEVEYLRKCNGIFTMGKWYAKDLIERTIIPAPKVHHVGGGINLDPTKIDYSIKNGNKVLFVGRDYKRKGLDITISAFKKLQEQLPEAEIYVAGPDTDPYSNVSIAGYHFMGDCNRDTLSKLFNMCDIFCMPSYFEAYGLVFIEALTYGLPCIGRNRYEMPYFIQDGTTGYLIDNDDIDELANKMKLALTNEVMKENVRANRDYYIEEYSWDTVAKRMSKFINMPVQ